MDIPLKAFGPYPTPNSKRDLFMRIPGGVFKGGGKIKDELAKNLISGPDFVDLCPESCLYFMALGVLFFGS